MKEEHQKLLDTRSCYFMAKLEDDETSGSKPIIWIDDPISSLDSNHVFFIYSIINAEIIKKKIHQQVFTHHRAAGFVDQVAVQDIQYENHHNPETRSPPARPVRQWLHVIDILGCHHDDWRAHKAPSTQEHRK